MSLSTVAAPISQSEPAHALPPSRPERFQPSDFVAAGIVFLVTLVVYIATLAPNVTLEDSGELITGATKFGVPHPPGYPLWTMSGFLISHLFPFGSLAWRVNLLSALLGATANAVLTLLVCHSGRWLLQRWAGEEVQATVRPFAFYAGMLAGFSIGFSDVMWGQAVISAVHGTLNALFVILVLLFFYLWMLEPQKTHRLIYTVFIFALGLTNHHTLIQIIPAILLAVLLLRAGKFWSVFLAVNLFSLSILVYLSWLSADEELHRISEWMALFILLGTAVVAFYYLKQFRLKPFLAGVVIAALFFAYGQYVMGPSQSDTLRYTTGPLWRWGQLVHPGWLQLSTHWGVTMLALAALALGLIFTCSLDRRLIIGVFVAGWVGLTPYAYESFASSTHPPMNWGFAAERAGFYYAVSRQQYPMSLPDLIKDTIGKAIGVIPHQEQPDTAIGQPDYFHRLWLTFYYYGDNLQENFTVPLLILGLAVLLYLRRSDWRQLNWFLFLAFAWLFVGFMLQLIEPQEGFDFERNLQYKVFHLQSHCILVMLMAYGALGVMTYLQQEWPEIVARTGAAGLGLPALCLSLLPLWSNAAHCDQADHWFGYYFGYNVMQPMEKNAVYLGGSDFGRFVPTYMAFVESQQPERWKRDPHFDRRDVAVITQNALCDTFYCHYIRDQYDPRFRPKPDQYTPFEKWLGRDTAYPKEPVTCLSEQELSACWNEFQSRPDVAARVAKGEPALREGTGDVFEINGIVARKIFEENKAAHTFYLEQSVAMPWTYPYLLPSGLIFKFNPEPMKSLPPAVIEADRRYWDACEAALLADPHFRPDADATVTFGKLAAWHADLYHYWHLEGEEEHWLKIALALCPQLQDTVSNLSRLLAQQDRFDEAIAVVRQAELDDPRTETYPPILDGLMEGKTLAGQEKDVRAQLGKTPKSPYDVDLNLQLARVLQAEGKFPELNQRLGFIAGLTNWDRAGLAGVVEYYVNRAGNPDAAIAFLEARAKIDPKADQMVYSLAALHASLDHKDAALKYLAQAASVGGTNVLLSAKVDPRFASLRDDPRYQALQNAPPAVPPPPAKVLPAKPSKHKKGK
jgi:tetratricopeptide (TPR) repeat protein